MFTRYNDIRARRARGEDQGFSLIELLVVVVIMGILIAIAVPVYLNYQEGAKKKSVEADVRNAIPAVEQCISNNNGTVNSDITLAAVVAKTDLAGECTDISITVTDGNTLSVTPGTGTYTITVYRTDDDPDYTVTYDSSDGSMTKA